DGARNRETAGDGKVHLEVLDLDQRIALPGHASVTSCERSTGGASGCRSQHAARCSSLMGVISGASAAQMFIAYGQRGWYGQPGGGWRMFGGGPAMDSSRRSFLRSSRGTALSKAQVYGCLGCSKISSPVPASAT